MQRSTASRSGQREIVLLWSLRLLGFTICFPALMIPNRTVSPRWTDAFLAVTMAAAIWFYDGYSRSKKPYIIAGFGLIPILLSVAAQKLTYRSGLEFGDMVFYGRWVASIVAGSLLAAIFVREKKLVEALFIGLVAGSTLHLLTIWIGQLGGISILLNLGFASPRVFAKTAAYAVHTTAQSRVTTLSETPNGANLLLALAIPAALGYTLIRRSVSGKTSALDYALIAAAVVVVLNGFFFTLTRSSTFAAFVGFLVYYFQTLKKNRRYSTIFVPLLFVMLILFALIMVWSAGVDIGFGRIENRIEGDSNAHNLAGRFDTWIATLSLIRQNPFGLAWAKSQAVYLTDSLVASHNGYLFTARTGGILLAVYVAIGHLFGVGRAVLSRKIDAAAPLIIYTVMAMFAEDLTQGASMTFIVALIACTGFYGREWSADRISQSRRKVTEGSAPASAPRKRRRRAVSGAQAPVD